ncbi:glycosyltransferase family 39 protein [Paracoccus sp. SCSIO 75233]|uniref:ArnT family glycosyltransferase n=1 Tax=Paracoccus sp. SCSIO 75233 TaxID=3017782 RepID=UPI0022F12227|nr:glycosyltransferase family 39 protein [Paracoccus sp. SCSIO 75233]WBU51857.1 glycosyltransferase family 39 protein [Paracoccus sp. SCSIO 75233]
MIADDAIAGQTGFRGRIMPLYALVFLLSLLALAPGIATLPVTDRDEARFAQASRQMAASGDWIDIRFQDETRYKKPAGSYWLQAAAIRLTGQGANAPMWVHRLPSLIAAALAAVALIWAGTPMVGGRAAAISAGMLATILIVQVEARLAKTDAALLLASVLAMGAIFRVWLGQSSARVAAIFWVAIACGLLLKGPVILLPVAGLVLWLWLTDGRPSWLAGLYPLRGLALMAVIALPWFIAITIISDGQFLTASLLQDFGSKLSSGQESHGSPPGSYVLGFLLSFWPWTALAPLAGIWLWRNRRARAGRLILGWVIPAWIVLELVPTKLVHYPMNLYPALLLAVAAVAVQLIDRAAAFRGWPALLGALIFILTLTGLTGLMILGPMRLGDGAAPLAVTGGVLALLLGGAALFWLWRGRGERGCASLGLCGAVMLATAAWAGLPAMIRLWISERLAAESAANLCARGPVALAGFHEPSAVFRLGTDTILTDADSARALVDSGQVAGAWIAVPQDAPTADAPEVAGLNYSNGREVRLRLYRPAQAAHPTCEETGS